MKTLVFLLEELSMRRFLEGLLPRVASGDVTWQFISFEGKQDLEAEIVRKLRGWLTPNTSFFVVRDQDNADCRSVKDSLVAKCKEAGKPKATVRIACRELEAWYFGDPKALAEAYSEPTLASIGNKAKFREPDAIGSPSRELMNLIPGFKKTDGARRMGAIIDVEGRNASKSFERFLASLRAAVA